MFRPLDIDVWLVFRNTVGAVKPWWRLLDDGFEHVEIWREDHGAWARMEPAMTVGNLEVWLKSPWEVIPSSWRPTYLRVQRTLREPRVRVPFHVGPLTCVDGAKMFLGVWAPTVWTPRQLYNYCIGRFDCECFNPVEGDSTGQSPQAGDAAPDGAGAVGPGRGPLGADASAGPGAGGPSRPLFGSRPLTEEDS